MLQYLLKRAGMSLLVVLLAMIFLSLLTHLVPGDPVQALLGPRATPELSKIVRAEMHLDDPVPVQVWEFIAGALRGDLGRDFVSRVSVVELIRAALPHTVVLALSSLMLAVLIGVPLGAYTATRQNTLSDRALGALSVSFITVPSYVAGLLLLLLFAVYFPVLPAVGAGRFSDPLDYAKHLILPSVALAITWIGYLARLVRAGMLEVQHTNYIRAARAFGLRERVIVYKYTLKNAVIPTIAILGVGLGNLMGGAIFVEVIFSRPGLGTLIFNAIITRNFPIVRGGVMVVALLFVLANLLADLSYRLLDPRIRVEEARPPI